MHLRPKTTVIFKIYIMTINAMADTSISNFNDHDGLDRR